MPNRQKIFDLMDKGINTFRKKNEELKKQGKGKDVDYYQTRDWLKACHTCPQAAYELIEGSPKDDLPYGLLTFCMARHQYVTQHPLLCSLNSQEEKEDQATYLITQNEAEAEKIQHNEEKQKATMVKQG